MKDKLIGKVFPVLDDGHIVLIDCMGDDGAIVDAARVSFGTGTRSVSDDRTLLRYLMRHHHSTPFEMAEIKLRVRVPMDCWRQWIRHRTANVNEYSTRYSEAIDRAHRAGPDAWRLQATGNKQGSVGLVTDWPEGFPVHSSLDAMYLPEGTTPGDYLSDRERMVQGHARAVYEERLQFGVAREQARKDLPLSTYTDAYWKCDLRNVLHFLGLRMDSHAQQEIRAYAEVIGREIVAPLFPLTWQAFEDYHLGAMTLSRLEVQAVAEAGKRCYLEGGQMYLEDLFPSRREREECQAKLVRLGMVPGRES